MISIATILSKCLRVNRFRNRTIERMLVSISKQWTHKWSHQLKSTQRPSKSKYRGLGPDHIAKVFMNINVQANELNCHGRTWHNVIIHCTLAMSIIILNGTKRRLYALFQWQKNSIIIVEWDNIGCSVQHSTLHVFTLIAILSFNSHSNGKQWAASKLSLSMSQAIAFKRWNESFQMI